MRHHLVPRCWQVTAIVTALGLLGGSAVAAGVAEPAPSEPVPSEPVPSDPRDRTRWGALRAAGERGPEHRVVGLTKQHRPTPPPVRPTPSPTPAPLPTVVVTAPSYESPGGTVPVIVTARNAPASQREALGLRTGGGARVDCDSGTSTNPVRRSVSRRCYVTTAAAGGYTLTGFVTVAGRTVTSPGVRLLADGRSTPPMPLAEVRRTERCHNTGSDVWLTFDDGYVSVARLDRILGTLRANRVRARFFLVGSWARANPWAASRIIAAGHVVHNHTATHAALSRASDATVRSEIRAGLRSTARPALLRPPYGSGALTARLASLARAEGFAVCRWTTDTRDWEGASGALMAERVRYGDATTSPVQAGGNILLHLGAPNTAAGLQQVIDAVRARGLRLDPLP